MGKPFTDYVPPKTYIFVPTCPLLKKRGNVYVSGSGEHAEDWMENTCGLPKIFYLTSAPCPDCAVMLADAYKRGKPTIYIARPYTGKGKTGKGSKDVNMQCLAMLVQAGFKLLPWNWKSFSKYVTSNQCKNDINEMFNRNWSATYSARIKGTRNALNAAKKMAKSKTNYSTKCRNALKG